LHSPFFKITATLLVGLLAALICVALKTPLPWMIGPLLSTAVWSMLNGPTQSWTPLRNVGQWVIGAALGLYFTPQTNALVLQLWWLVVLAIVWSLALGCAFGRWLHWHNAARLPDLNPATAYFASAIGGASEMTLLAERERARTDLVASAHSLRILMVTLIVPFAIQWMGWHGQDAAFRTPLPVQAEGFGLLALLTGVGALVMRALKRPNAWFIGPLLISVLLTSNQVSLSGVPVELTNAAQWVIGVSLGVRFNASFVHTAPRWLLSAAWGTAGMMALCALFAWGLSHLTPFPVATLILATAPGGIAEMAITAKVLQLGPAVVTAFQVCRLVGVLFLADPLYHRLKPYMQAPDNPRP
jgi:membrane AbrB-like protein